MVTVNRAFRVHAKYFCLAVLDRVLCSWARFCEFVKKRAKTASENISAPFALIEETLLCGFLH